MDERAKVRQDRLAKSWTPSIYASTLGSVTGIDLIPPGLLSASLYTIFLRITNFNPDHFIDGTYLYIDQAKRKCGARGRCPR